MRFALELERVVAQKDTPTTFTCTAPAPKSEIRAPESDGHSEYVYVSSSGIRNPGYELRNPDPGYGTNLSLVIWLLSRIRL